MLSYLPLPMRSWKQKLEVQASSYRLRRRENFRVHPVPLNFFFGQARGPFLLFRSRTLLLSPSQRSLALLHAVMLYEIEISAHAVGETEYYFILDSTLARVHPWYRNAKVSFGTLQKPAVAQNSLCLGNTGQGGPHQRCGVFLGIYYQSTIVTCTKGRYRYSNSVPVEYA